MSRLVIPKSLIHNSSIECIDCDLDNLFIKKNNLSFGKFHLLSLYTYSKTIVFIFTKYCRENGYTEKWHFNNGKYELTKVPMALLVKIISEQDDESAKEMCGAWSIGMSNKSTCINVIESVYYTTSGNIKINKFSLYYNNGFKKNKKECVPIIDGISFRTAIFNGDNIEECRYILFQLSKLKSEILKPIICDSYRDAIYLKNPNQWDTEKKFKIIDDFVNLMVTKFKPALKDSFVDSGQSVLEDEWTLINKVTNYD
tara:strand:- start:6832 stop:7599 length:768 start_codon:yes stop_codon:yes gene_type:complete